MSKQPDGGKAPNDKSSKPGKPGVKSDTYSQVPDKDSDKVKGGMMAPVRGVVGRKATLDPTDTSGCCG